MSYECTDFGNKSGLSQIDSPILGKPNCRFQSKIHILSERTKVGVLHVNHSRGPFIVTRVTVISDQSWDHNDCKTFIRVYSQSRNFKKVITENESSNQDASIPAGRGSIRPAVQKLQSFEVDTSTPHHMVLALGQVHVSTRKNT